MQVFENGVFLFFAHPFDVGDAIKFEDNRYDVNAINLQYVNLTHVLGADVNVPTSEMRVARITNITRCARLLALAHLDEVGFSAKRQVCCADLLVAHQPQVNTALVPMLLDNADRLGGCWERVLW